jgi:hypothetical protein
MAEQARIKILTPKARLSFPNLFRARAVEEGKEPTFSCTLLFSPEAQQTPEFAAMKAAAASVVTAKWGQNVPANLRSPFRKAEEKADKEGYEPGWVFINCSSKQRPGVVQNTPTGLQKVIDENEVYPGCWVIASLGPYAYDQKGNKGVSFGLNNVLKVGDGDALGGRSRAEDDFAGVAAPPAAAAGGAAAARDLFG